MSEVNTEDNLESFIEALIHPQTIFGGWVGN